MNCKKCNREIQPDWKVCPFCCAKLTQERHQRYRGNGLGSIYKDGDVYRATVVLNYYLGEDGKQHKHTRSKCFKTRKEAMLAIPKLFEAPVKEQKKRQEYTFKELYNKWLPTHDAGKSTLDCYKAAMKYFEPVWYSKMMDIDIDDLQECLDECGKGKRTQQNMKAVCGLIYKFGIPRQAIPENLNLAPFLKVRGEDSIHRESFTDEQIQAIKAQIGITPGAEQVYCLIYLGLRPSEYLALKVDSYNDEKFFIVGGAKTAAGKGRTVTVSPKIRQYLSQMKRSSSSALVSDSSQQPYTLNRWTDTVFYPVLKAAGIDNPMVDIAEGMKRHKYSPHSCRHTFSTLMKRVSGADKDKLELIGHTSDEMLRYYQDVSLEDLHRITNKI